MMLMWLIQAAEIVTTVTQTKASIVNTKIDQKEEKIDFAVGGQAVIEGVMMRSPNNMVIAVRKKDKSIKVKKNPYRTLTQKYKILDIPILRGIINLFEMMVIGTKAINYSANETIEDELSEDEKKKIQENGKTKAHRAIEMILFGFSIVVALALSLFLFKFVPLWLTTVLEKNVTYVEDNWMLFNLIDGVLKMLIFLSYIFLLTLGKSFRRIFEYHGAEHKSIFTYENHLPLTVTNAKKQTRFHPRCGTSFILIVFTISILIYTLVPKQPDFLHNLIMRLAFLPLIAGISYEFLKLSARFQKSAIVRASVAPGLWFQRLTTKEPDDSQLKVGLKSLGEALEMEKK